ncbi:uncharacterized protein MONOS_12676 [Monocercomonoides exilis]|uniref:uncharacterized protein n=1 Tax=Monocercomonoides exilis TaxID=2049356 RepID=UPI00355A5CDD|nr:hypothetical protein MONOS_12676 [Monocercomonoides exilis]|eukprot:MONOS_12676.1-p1 / transcript=MONOS_12676.1 / gene=MONOS_12676 / organism=Monocercomonoides_exilis_PA203 / gene_product=unspecified product / transcript_product=unspecified product / location=Mono_scaffold00718:2902-3934(+) / protein_length=166 / sequence_SO=supercontig / SO=protein_coding / is_pseudo=false
MDFGSSCVFRANQVRHALMMQPSEYVPYGEEEEEEEKEKDEEKEEGNKGKTQKGLTYRTPKGMQGMRMKKEQRAPFGYKIDHKRGTSTSSSLAKLVRCELVENNFEQADLEQEKENAAWRNRTRFEEGDSEEEEEEEKEEKEEKKKKEEGIAFTTASSSSSSCNS